jgi:phage terminase Nu1 subunit (DNA packaging protein)
VRLHNPDEITVGPKRLNLSQLADAFDCDRRTLARLLGDLPADVVDKIGDRQSPQWRLDRVLKHPGVIEHLRPANAGANVLDLEQERAKLARAQAEKTEIEVARLRNQLIETDLAQLWIQRLLLDARTRLLALPTAGATLLQRCKTLHDIKEEYERQIHDALRDLAETDPDRLVNEVLAMRSCSKMEDDGNA